MAQGGDGHVAQHPLDEVHQVAVVPVGLVELHHGELGIVPGGEALVPEVAVDLEHLLQAAHHQALEVELRRDAEIELHVEGVVVGDEGLGRGAAGDGMHHRRLHLQEAVGHHELADALDDLRAADEGLPGLLVGDQIQVALAVLLLLVAEAVELLGQGAQGLGQQADLAGQDGQLVGLGAEQGAPDAEDVAQVHALEGVVGRLAHVLPGDVDLDAAAHVLQGGEAGLAHHPLQHHPAGQLHLDRVGLEVLLGGLPIAGMLVAGEVPALEVVGEGRAQGAQFFQLGAALGDELVFVGGLFLGARGEVLLFGHGGFQSVFRAGLSRPDFGFSWKGNFSYNARPAWVVSSAGRAADS